MSQQTQQDVHPNFHLVNLAGWAKRLPHPILIMVLVLVFPIFGEIIADLIGLENGIVPVGESATVMQGAFQLITMLVAGFGPTALALWLWLRFYEKRPFWTIGLEPAGALRKLGRGFLGGTLMFGASVLIMALFGFVAIEPGDPQQQGLVTLLPVLLTLIGWGIQASTEEFLARGWLLPVISKRTGKVWLGVLLSSLIFAALHLLNPNLSWVAVLNLVLVGIFLALWALWEGGIWGVCGFHISWNWAQGNLFGFEVSGQSVQGGILFNLMETGPGIITGDAFGPEAGLAVTAVLIIGIIITVTLLRKNAAIDHTQN